MRSRLGWVADLLAVQPGTRVLEVGCGTGALAALLAERGAEVLAVDRSSAMAAAARRRGIEVVCDDVETADLGGRRFDVAVAVNVAPLFERRRLVVVAAVADRVVLVSEAPPQMDVEATHDALVARVPGTVLLRERGRLAIEARI